MEMLNQVAIERGELSYCSFAWHKQRLWTRCSVQFVTKHLLSVSAECLIRLGYFSCFLLFFCFFFPNRSE